MNLLNGELKMSAKPKAMGCYSPKYPELDNNAGLVFKSFVFLKQ